MQHPYIAKRHWSQTAGISLAPDMLARFDDVIDLSVGDMDVPTDERIIDAACRDAKAGYTTYGMPQGDPELITAVCDYYRTQYDMAVSPAEVYVTASSLLGMELSLMAILNPGDEVLLFSPYFSPYREQVVLAGGVPVEVPTDAADGYAIREELLRAAITDRTRAVIFNNPVNPTGVVYGMETLTRLADVAKAHDLLVLADEIYTHYDYTGRFVPIRSLPGMAERTITQNSFSKNYLMTGWRIGYIVAPPFLVDTVQSINSNIVYTAPAISQRAAIEAIRIRGSIAEKYIQDYKQRVFYAAGRMRSIPYLSLQEPQGTFYLFPGIEKTGLSSEAFAKMLFETCHIIVTPGIAFGAAGEGHFRMVCTAPMEQLAATFDRMEQLTF